LLLELEGIGKLKPQQEGKQPRNLGKGGPCESQDFLIARRRVQRPWAHRVLIQLIKPVL